MSEARTGPGVSVIVVSWNTRDLLRVSLRSVTDHLGSLAPEIIVVDNASHDGSAEMVAAEFPAAKVIRNDRNLGFGTANNIAMAVARAPVFLLLNSDARLVDGSLVAVIERLRANRDISVIGPRLRFEDGRLQASAHRFSSLGLLALEELGLYKLFPRERRGELLLGGYWDHLHERQVDWIVGACMLLRREVYETTGGFDPSMFLYGEEVEWCERIRAAGFQIAFSPSAEVVHVGHASTKNLVGEQGRIDMCLAAADREVARHQGSLAGGIAATLRVTGAVLKTIAFGGRRLVVGDDEYGRDVLASCRMVLRHYVGRLTART